METLLTTEVDIFDESRREILINTAHIICMRPSEDDKNQTNLVMSNDRRITIEETFDFMTELMRLHMNTGHSTRTVVETLDVLRKVYDLLDEIEAICIGADSPDAIKLGEVDAAEETNNLRDDISAISTKVMEIKYLLDKI